jgi:tRNA-uridine 2-sulfurtransferase
MNKKTVVLAMSGGVDSSVAAYLLRKQGYSVIGLTLKLWDDSDCAKQGLKSCCSADAINDARHACSRLGIPHYVADYAKQFKSEVIDSFLDSYKKGLTPNPCIICNERIKFPVLLKQAKTLGADCIATGHYARCGYSRINRRFVIKEAKDRDKDQSYVLFSLSQGVLSRLILPIGDYKKGAVRSIAKRLKFNSYKRKESQEICFVKDNDLKSFLKNNLGSHITKGVIKDATGKSLACHDGACLFTIGQRRGLRVPYGSPIYVTDINHKTSEITVGSYSDTLRKDVHVKDINWIIGPNKARSLNGIKVKIRYKHKKAQADIKLDSPHRVLVVFKKPQSAPTPGQAAVFYRRDTVIGGGWISA